MRLRPVALVVTLALGLLAVPLPAEAEQAGESPANRCSALASVCIHNQGVHAVQFEHMLAQPAQGALIQTEV